MTSIWLRIPGVNGRGLAELLSNICSNADKKELAWHKPAEIPEGSLLSNPEWLEITFTSIQTLLQLLGVLASYRSIKIAMSSDGKGAKTIVKGANPTEIETAVAETKTNKNKKTKKKKSVTRKDLKR